MALDLLKQCVQRLQLTGGMLNKDLARDITKFISLAGQADTGTGAPEADVHMGDSLADLRKGEGGPVGVGGQADVGKPSDAAEHGNPPEQTRAAEKLEAVHPNAAIYRRSE